MRQIDAEMEERILTFMESFSPGNTEALKEMEKEALDAAVPIIRTQTQSLLRFLLELQRPMRILEVGTATGFSACLLLQYAPAGAELTTIERDSERIAKARENFAAMDRDTARGKGWCPPRSSDRIVLLEGEADDILERLEGTYDLIFMDAAKGQYINFLPKVLDRMHEGSLLVSDNVFKDGEILESRYAVKRRDRTIHRRMREYLFALTHSAQLQTVLLQEGDGAALSVRTGAEQTGIGWESDKRERNRQRV